MNLKITDALLEKIISRAAVWKSKCDSKPAAFFYRRHIPPPSCGNAGSTAINKRPHLTVIVRRLSGGKEAVGVRFPPQHDLWPGSRAHIDLPGRKDVSC